MWYDAFLRGGERVGDSELVLRFEGQAQLSAEHAQNLSQGRAFVPSQTHLPLFSRCLLRLEHPSTHTWFEIECEVVMVMEQGAMRGSALQFVDRSPEALHQLTSFVNHSAAMDAGDDDPTGEYAPSEAPDLPIDPDAEDTDEDAADSSDPLLSSAAKERQLKLRNLPQAERMKIARGGSLDDRTLLERIYGNLVWEPLLRNPKITVPEVARMARKGTMPRPLLELIVDNEQWIRQSVVRRALLSNPRLSPEGAAKVLRTLSHRELKLIPQQTAYPPSVRTVAQRLMGKG